MLALSSPAGIGLIFLGFALMIVMIIIVANRLSKKRTEGLKVLAEELNITFDPEWDSSFIESLKHFYLFSRGRRPTFANVLQSRLDDIDVLVFDYFYTVNMSGQSQVVEQTVMLFQSKTLRLPSFLLWPQNILHRVGKSFGYQDIDFTSHPEFSRKYLLQGENEEEIREVFNEDVLSFYEKHRKTSTEAIEGQLIFYRNAKPVPLKKMRSFIEDGIQLIELLKKCPSLSYAVAET